MFCTFRNKLWHYNNPVKNVSLICSNTQEGNMVGFSIFLGRELRTNYISEDIFENVSMALIIPGVPLCVQL